MTDIDKTLAERGTRYGVFNNHAEITQDLKQIMHGTDKWDSLEYDQAECLDMVAHKIGRILNGDPNYIDSWTDIIGYVRLVEKRLIAEEKTEAKEGPCTDPNCPKHGPAVLKVIEAMRAAGLI